MSKKSSFASLCSASSSKYMSWKNGAGSSRELAIEPPGMNFIKDKFLWRLSSAIVDKSGPFSLFDGYERMLSIIEGTELELNFNGGEERIFLRQGELAFRFSGSSAVEGIVSKGPIKDLGLIFKAKFVRPKWSVLRFNTLTRSFRLDARVVFFFVVSGELVASCYPGEAVFSLGSGDALRLDPAQTGVERLVLLEPKSQDALVMGIEIDF